MGSVMGGSRGASLMIFSLEGFRQGHRVDMGMRVIPECPELVAVLGETLIVPPRGGHLEAFVIGTEPLR